MQTLVIGLDAACRPVLDRLIETDDVPTLESLLESGTAGDLTSQVPPWTPSAWPSLYAGVNPGKHGVFGFLTYEGYEWDVVNATDVRERTVWEVLDERGLTSVVVNAPVTHPPPEIDGAVVPGYVAPEDPDCHPPGLLDDLRAEIGDYRVYADRDAGDDRAARVASYRDLVGMRGEAFRHLCDRFAPDFGFVQFQQTDTVFHECPGDWDAVRAVYRAVDEEIRRTLDDCAPDVVLVVSDHGIGEYGGCEVRVNDVLRERGYVDVERGSRSMPSWGTVGRALQRGERDPETGAKSPAETALAVAASAGLTSQRIGAVLDRLGLREAVVERVPMDLVKAAAETVDFADSRAYMRDRIELGVRINLEGREPDGVVPPDRYERVRDDLVDLLRGVTTPSGEPVFSTVAPREAVFDGPYVEEAPDVIVVPDRYDHFLSAQIRDDPFAAEPREPWNHKLQGIVALAGEGVDETADVSDAHLFDVAPTILASMGLPAGDHMDGQALPAVTSTGVTAYPDYERTADRATDDATVESRLADLGYLE